jgi:DNA-binding transcriptional LysR family regulator
MDIRQLKYFIAVAEELNFTRAAERVGIAQPPLSQQIIGLEYELRAELFHRSKRKVELTEAGHILLPHAQRILNATHEAAEAVQAAMAGKRGSIRIGAIYSSMFVFLPALLRRFHTDYPSVTVQVEEMTITQQFAALNEGLIDVGLMRGTTDIADYSSRALFEEEFIVALPTGHPLVKHSTIRLAQLADYPFLDMSRRSNQNYFELVHGVLATARVQPNVVQQASDMHTLLCLVGSGLGLALVPSSMRSSPIKHVTYRSISDPTPRTNMRLVWRTENASLVMPKLVQTAVEVGDQLTEEDASEERASIAKILATPLT